MIAQIDILNLALALLGEEKLSSTSDGTKAARLTTFFELSYRACLELPYNWKFATVYTEIASTDDTVIGNFAYRYPLPSKCLRVIAKIDVDDESHEYAYRRELYVNDSDEEVSCIVANEDSCYIKYLRDVSDISKWPAWFCRLVAIDLAIIMCEPLKQDKQKKNQLLVMKDEPVVGWLAQAVKANGMEDSDVNSSNINTTNGNNDVLNASLNSEYTETPIVYRE